MKQTLKQRTQKGFTLMELLITVAIVAILVSVSIPGVRRLQGGIRQKELNTKAELIYNAVQNELSRLKSTGQSAVYQSLSGLKPVELIPDDIAYIDALDEDQNRQLYYFTSESEGSAPSALMNMRTIDQELLAGNWVVEYEPFGALVYAVFYCDAGTEMDYPGARGGKGGIGYYGGGRLADVGVSSTEVMKLRLVLENDEKLLLKLYGFLPEAVYSNGAFCGQAAELSITITDSDENDKPAAQTIPLNVMGGDHYTLDFQDSSFLLTLTLDDLSDPSTRFHSLYPTLTPGSDITVEAVLFCTESGVQPVEKSKTTNSLFAYSEGKDASCAFIASGRHLQNLDKSSGVSPMIVKAKLLNDVHLERDNAFYSAYEGSYFNGCGEGSGTPLFKPVTNGALRSLDGYITRTYSNGVEFQRSGIISGLCEESSAGALGLFGDLKVDAGEEFSVSNLNLTGEILSVRDNQQNPTLDEGFVGALIGRIYGGGTVTVESVQAYLNKGEESYTLRGHRVGGLVGAIEDSHLTIRDSSASLNLIGNNALSCVGGLVGRCFGKSSPTGDGSLTLQSSYADCIMTSPGNVGGLVGENKGSLTLADCYAAGYAAGESVFALVNGSVSSAVRSYSCLYWGSYSRSLTGSDDNLPQDVFYLDDETPKEALLKLGTPPDGESAFALASMGASRPYLIKDTSLKDYPYPVLRHIAHYGDWRQGYEDGALVYYEVYQEGGAGFFGANLPSSIAEGSTPVRDGFGLVYKVVDESVDIPISTVVATEFIDEHYSVNYDDENAYITVYITRNPGETSRFRIYPIAELTNPQNQFPFYLPVSVTDQKSGVRNTRNYWIQPDFAACMSSSSRDTLPPAIAPGSTFKIRSPRQLYALSRHYDSYVAANKQSTFVLGSDLDYNAYQWWSLSGVGVEPSQTPIGKNAPFYGYFQGNYHSISNVDLVSDNSFVGLFGQNNGTIQNVFLVRSGAAPCFVNYYTNDQVTEVYQGSMCGKNNGMISNCAVSGYLLTGTAADSPESSYTVGGFVGSNTGSIESCTVVFPDIQTEGATALGGFAGCNYGGESKEATIRSCYALGKISAAVQETAVIGGFYSHANEFGCFESCYAATAISENEEAVSCGFGTEGKSENIENCYYLKAGNYSFLGQSEKYCYTQEGFGSADSYSAMKEKRGVAEATHSHLFNQINADLDGSEGYPFAATVRRDGSLAHFGDWPVLQEPKLGISNNTNYYELTVYAADTDEKTSGTGKNVGPVLGDSAYSAFLYFHEGDVEEAGVKKENLTIRSASLHGDYNGVQTAFGIYINGAASPSASANELLNFDLDYGDWTSNALLPLRLCYRGSAGESEKLGEQLYLSVTLGCTENSCKYTLSCPISRPSETYMTLSYQPGSVNSHPFQPTGSSYARYGRAGTAVMLDNCGFGCLFCDFDGWMIDGVKHTAGTSVVLVADMTLTAAWKQRDDLALSLFLPEAQPDVSYSFPAGVSEVKEGICSAQISLGGNGATLALPTLSDGSRYTLQWKLSGTATFLTQDQLCSPAILDQAIREDWQLEAVWVENTAE